MKFFTNHSGILSALIVGVAIISSAFLLTRDNPATFAERAVASPSSALREQVIEKDTDGDGLLDWEETLWGTDPFVVDTDGDGILDGEFVASRKQDKAPEEIIEFEDLNFTSQFSRTFFAEYLRFQSDGELSEGEKNVLISRLMNSIDIDLPLAFSPNQFATTGTSDAEVLEYFRSIVIYFQKATPEGAEEGELKLLEEALTNDDPALFETIEDIAFGYARLANTLAQMEVPKTLTAHHAALVTATNRLSTLSYIFANTQNDALQSIAALPEYEEEVKRFTTAITAIHNEVSSREAIANDNDVVAAKQALGL
ncbi:MAG: hypothetical protein ACJKSS_00680 [Patescibacteria group bacterium UBA2103]